METKVNLQELLAEIKTIPYTLDGSGAYMLYSPSTPIPALDPYPCIRQAIREISELRSTPPLHLMINILRPGVSVPVHRDWILPTRHQKEHPTVERWHLAVQTNEEARYWNEIGDTIHIPLGKWFGPISYWKQHSVWNSGKEERIHIVVDLDSPEPIGSYN